jgi:tetratricopeptide (TPR) repeat protein
VQRRLTQAQTALDFGFSSALESQKDTVRAMLERQHAATSPDPRLRYDLGYVYLLLGRTEARGYYVRAAETLRDALAMAPDHPAAEEGWSRLAEACGHIGDHECERRAYTEVLRLMTEEADRGTATLNLAETEMHLGNLKEAIAGYREAQRIAARYPSRTLAPLALWGLAVALDRSGDRATADKEAIAVLEMQASSGMRNLLRSPGVFFYPEYELAWYDAVGAMALARKAGASLDEAARQWKNAELAFTAYIRSAEGKAPPDRWLGLAKVRLESVRRERQIAEKRNASGQELGPPRRGPRSEVSEEKPL